MRAWLRPKRIRYKVHFRVFDVYSIDLYAENADEAFNRAIWGYDKSVKKRRDVKSPMRVRLVYSGIHERYAAFPSGNGDAK